MWYDGRAADEGCEMKTMLCAAALLAAALPARAAEKCALPQIAALTLKPLGSGEYTIPVSIGGAERRFVLGLNNPFSAISGPLADQLGYETRRLPPGISPHLNAETVTRQVRVGELAIGSTHAKDFHMLRVDAALTGSGADGVAGLDLLENFDVELDLKAGKLNLFSQAHCQGNVVYWAPSYAEVPFKTDASGHVSFVMTLDDRKVTVDLDMREGSSVMGSKTLRRLFDLAPGSPGMVTETQGGTTFWHYPFKTLAVEGIAIADPHIAILSQDGPECRPEAHWIDGREGRCFGSSDLHLRAPVLRALHLYFAFKEKMLYVTPADAHL